jgi:hypothetical protein
MTAGSARVNGLLTGPMRYLIHMHKYHEGTEWYECISIRIYCTAAANAAGPAAAPGLELSFS